MCTLFVIVFFYFIFFLVTITTICEATVNGNFAMINTVVFFQAQDIISQSKLQLFLLKVTTYV